MYAVVTGVRCKVIVKVDYDSFMTGKAVMGKTKLLTLAFSQIMLIKIITTLFYDGKIDLDGRKTDTMYLLVGIDLL